MASGPPAVACTAPFLYRRVGEGHHADICSLWVAFFTCMVRRTMSLARRVMRQGKGWTARAACRTLATILASMGSLA